MLHFTHKGHGSKFIKYINVNYQVKLTISIKTVTSWIPLNLLLIFSSSSASYSTSSQLSTLGIPLMVLAKFVFLHFGHRTHHYGVIDHACKDSVGAHYKNGHSTMQLISICLEEFLTSLCYFSFHEMYSEMQHLSTIGCMHAPIMVNYGPKVFVKFDCFSHHQIQPPSMCLLWYCRGRRRTLKSKS